MDIDNGFNDNHTLPADASQQIRVDCMIWTNSPAGFSDEESLPNRPVSTPLALDPSSHDEEDEARAYPAYPDGCLRDAHVKDMGRLCTVAMALPDDLTLAARESIRHVILEKNDASRDNPNRIEVQQHEWQVAAAAEILCGCDTYVVTATGTGKTMCFLLALFARPGSIIVISPLLALMDDQVAGAARLAIKAVQISEQTIQADLELVNKVRQGEFHLVFLQPEFCHGSNGLW